MPRFGSPPASPTGGQPDLTPKGSPPLSSVLPQEHAPERVLPYDHGPTVAESKGRKRGLRKRRVARKHDRGKRSKGEVDQQVLGPSPPSSATGGPIAAFVGSYLTPTDGNREDAGSMHFLVVQSIGLPTGNGTTRAVTPALAARDDSPESVALSQASSTRRGSPSTSSPRAGPASPEESPRTWCLVVDDAATNRDFLAGFLARRGLTVSQAENGKLAVQACRQRAQELDALCDGSSTAFLGLITMDRSMTVMDGVEATRAIRSEFENRFVIVGITGDALGDDLQSFKEAGLDAVLGKPVAGKQVLRTLRELRAGSF